MGKETRHPARTHPLASPQPLTLPRTTHQPPGLRGRWARFGHWRQGEGVRGLRKPRWVWSRADTCLSGVASTSQRKIASPTLRTCRWSGLKATACTGSEWPMYTWGQQTSHRRTARGWDVAVLQCRGLVMSPRPAPHVALGPSLRALGSRGFTSPGTHLATKVGLCRVTPHLDGPAGGRQQEAGILTESQGRARLRPDAGQL